VRKDIEREREREREGEREDKMEAELCETLHFAGRNEEMISF
jgi:hypothetical protein